MSTHPAGCERRRPLMSGWGLLTTLLALAPRAALPAIPASERQALIAFYDSTNGSTWAGSSWLGAPGTECSWWGVTCNAAQTAVVGLHLGVLDIYGTLAPELGNLTQLEELDLRDNYLSGSLPGELGNLSKLRLLDIRDNRLSGALPAEFGNLASLERLLLENDFTPTPYGNQVTGPIPPSFGQLSRLQVLDLSDNSLGGPLPPQLGDLANLREIRLTRNRITGPIPAELGRLPQLEILDLGENLLEGPLPPQLGDLPRIRFLSLRRNGLTGNIPPALGNLGSLSYLELDGNMLSGSIPPQLANLSLDPLHRSRLYFNKLHAEDPALVAFLNSYTSWGGQTVPPTSIRATRTRPDTITLSWTPIEFTYKNGAYRIYGASSPAGPYTVIASTASKRFTWATVAGLSSSMAFFTVETFTDSHYENRNQLISERSTPVTATDGHLLTVKVAGRGSVVTSSGLTCTESAEDSTCVVGLPAGTRATLSAAPADQFGAWGGHCVGSDPTTTVLLDRDRSCTARFGTVRLTQRTMTASNGPVLPGSAVRYSVTLGNTGTGDQRDNVGPELTDVLPAQLEAVSATATSGTVQVSGNAVYWNGAVPAGATVDLLIDARVRVDVPTGTTISNQATIAWDVDGDGANETTAPTDDPRSPGALDPTLIAVSPSLAFHTLEPCRAVDTRQEGPALAPGPERVFAMAGRCGVPTGAAAVAANLTVVGPTAGGHLRLHPAGTPSPDASSINYVAAATRANNAVLTLSPNGELAVDCRQPSGTVHLIIDVVGYFE